MNADTSKAKGCTWSGCDEKPVALLIVEMSGPQPICAKHARMEEERGFGWRIIKKESRAGDRESG